MKIIIVQIIVKSNCIQTFIDATIKSREATMNETGCIQYNIAQNVSDECQFILIEQYTSDEAIEFHRSTPHFLEWRNEVQETMAHPRTGTKHNLI